MDQYTGRIREIARRLLQESKVDVVLGFQRGTLPMINQPILINEPAQVRRLNWDSFCAGNLTTYLPRRRDRIALVVKGCDSRNVVLQILENQIKREQLSARPAMAWWIAAWSWLPLMVVNPWR